MAVWCPINQAPRLSAMSQLSPGWLGLLHCVLGQDTLLSQYLQVMWGGGGEGEGNKTCDGLTSRPNTPGHFKLSRWDKLEEHGHLPTTDIYCYSNDYDFSPYLFL